jgi:hypothetical protein
VNQYRGINFVQLPSPKSKVTEFTVIRITKDRLIAIPYDFTKKSWVSESKKVLDTKIKLKGNETHTNHNNRSRGAGGL